MPAGQPEFPAPTLQEAGLNLRDVVVFACCLLFSGSRSSLPTLKLAQSAFRAASPLSMSTICFLRSSALIAMHRPRGVQ